jgi:hypothetical protein
MTRGPDAQAPNNTPATMGSMHTFNAIAVSRSLLARRRD